MLKILVNQNSISSALCDAYDVRNALSAKIKTMPKDSEGTETTIGDCLDAIVELLEQLNTGEIK